MVTDGVDAGILQALRDALERGGAMLKLVAPMVGGVETSDGAWIEADKKIDGGPSVLFDAVAVLASKQGAEQLAGEATARDFAADAFAHLKFIAYVGEIGRCPVPDASRSERTHQESVFASVMRRHSHDSGRFWFAAAVCNWEQRT